VRLQASQSMLPLSLDLAHLRFDPRQSVGHGTRGFCRYSGVIGDRLGGTLRGHARFHPDHGDGYAG